MIAPSNAELQAAGYRLEPGRDVVALYLHDALICQSVLDGNCWAVARMHYRRAQLGPAEMKLFTRGLKGGRR